MERQDLSYFQGVKFPLHWNSQSQADGWTCDDSGFPPFSDVFSPSLLLCQHLFKQLHWQWVIFSHLRSAWTSEQPEDAGGCGDLSFYRIIILMFCSIAIYLEYLILGLVPVFFSKSTFSGHEKEGCGWNYTHGSDSCGFPRWRNSRTVVYSLALGNSQWEIRAGKLVLFPVE